MIKALVVEDEKYMADFINLELLHEGYSVDVCSDGDMGYNKAIKEDYDVIILDVMLPKMNGMEFCRKLRMNKKTPIIMLTAKSDVIDKVNGLDTGADDYLTKPFEIEELLARIRAIIRREERNVNKSDIIQIADLKMDTKRKKVSRGNVNIELTKKEYELLEYLMKNKGIVLSRDKIIGEVWNYDFVGDDKIVDVFIRYLRGKIDDGYDKKLINTVRGFRLCYSRIK